MAMGTTRCSACGETRPVVLEDGVGNVLCTDCANNLDAASVQVVRHRNTAMGSPLVTLTGPYVPGGAEWENSTDRERTTLLAMAVTMYHPLVVHTKAGEIAGAICGYAEIYGDPNGTTCLLLTQPNDTFAVRAIPFKDLVAIENPTGGTH